MRGCVKMKKLVKSLLVVSASLVAANSAVASMVDDFCPYVGIDFKARWAKERHFGSVSNNNRNNALLGGTIYVGSRWDCFGLEAGLEAAGRNRRTITFNNGATASAKGTLWGGYLDALAYAPVADCLEVFGGFGVGVLSPKITYSSIAGTPPFAGAATSGGSKAAAVARVRLGLNYMVSECVGLRGALGWESTENLAIRAGSISRFHPFANSFTLQAGIFAKF